MNSHAEQSHPKNYEEAYGTTQDDGLSQVSVKNAAILCCDQHPPAAIALRCMNAEGEQSLHTFGQLKERSARFANLLARHGVRPGDVVAVMLPRNADLIVAFLGIMRAGAVYQPLFTAFGPKAIEHRLVGSGAQIVVTDLANREKLDTIEQIRTVICSGGQRSGDVEFNALAQESDEFAPVARSANDPMLVLFTSGTTGKPKGVQVPYRAVHAFEVYMKYAIDLVPSDRYWNIADPGWAYGLYYAVVGPLLLGQATTFYSGSFSASSTCKVINDFEITNLAGAPTAFRMLVANASTVVPALRGKLRVVSSAGEALNAEVVRWFESELQCPIHDHYGQTEGGMVLANHHGLRHAVEPGTAGRAIPGVRAVIIDDQGRELPSGEVGELAIDRDASPRFWFGGYWACNTGVVAPPSRYHRSGDLAVMDERGTVTFVGRSDDVITSSGYRIGPFDVESTLMEHRAVAEVAVIGKPDPERTEIVKAVVVLKPNVTTDDATAEEMRLLVKNRLGAHAYPREIEFVAELPKTPSGKIQRFVLREREVQKLASTQ